MALAILVVAVSGFSLVSRLLRAAAAGDDESFHAQLLAALIAVPVIALLVIAVSLQFLPGQVRSARLRKTFPGEIVVTGRVNQDVRVLLRSWNSRAVAEGTMALPRLTFGMTAGVEGVAFWSGLRITGPSGFLRWGEIAGARVSTLTVEGKAYPRLQLTLAGAREISFGVASGKNLGRSRANAAELTALVEQLEHLRSVASRA